MKLFVFGLGYTATTLARRRLSEGWQVAGTVRTPEKTEAMRSEGIEAFAFDGDGCDPAIAGALADASHLLVSVPPGEQGDPVLRSCREAIERCGSLKWIDYLSTIGVYGDTGGQWIDEETMPAPPNVRTQRRVVAEAEWLALGGTLDVPTVVMRIAGIYGPGRNQLVQLRAGTAKRLVGHGQVFNRIHVEDIARVIAASMAKPARGRIYNLADDEPAAPQDVVTFAAQLIGVEPPPETDFGAADLSPMARSFYGASKRVSNRRIKDELGVTLAYPTYREGLRALAQSPDGM